MSGRGNEVGADATTAGEWSTIAAGPRPIDWREFWATDEIAHDWMIEPVLPEGRQTAIFGDAKSGKSLLSLEMASAKAVGRAVLGQPAGDPIAVTYIDAEMGRADLRERLLDLGYGPKSDLSLLSYYQLAGLPPLDTPAGGREVERILDVHGTQLLVVDTVASLTAGAEQDSDTIRHFFRYSGMAAKERGVTLLRIDHSGKDEGKGQRGTSHKSADVDVVLRLTAKGDAVSLAATHSRVPWVPPSVALTRRSDPLRHVLVDVRPEKQTDLIDTLTGQRNGLSAPEAAVLLGRDERTAKRRLDAMVDSGQAHRRPGRKGGIGGSEPDRYFAVIDREEP